MQAPLNLWYGQPARRCTISVLGWIFGVLAGIVGYELLRYIILRRVSTRLREGAVGFVRRHRIRLESARFIDRVWMREALAQDSAIEESVHTIARDTGQPAWLLRARVDEYVNEIAPVFSLSTYYRVGGTIAKAAVNFCYELRIEPGAFEAQLAKAPPDAIRVYVMNHRSNFDSLVLSYALLRKVALSYAVGEWALVWPLDSLFRSFGSYFVRRGERDPLYHAVLERFVQLLAGHGGVTGFYIEGGLSRDGLLRKPKVGLLDYLIKLRREHPDRGIVFMPVALNYDRVLEDRHLVAERNGPLPKPTPMDRLVTLGRIAVRVPVLIAANFLAVATRSHRKFGYASVNFGEPLRLEDWPGGRMIHDLEDAPRREAVAALADHLLRDRIGGAIAVTPVPLLCVALLRPGGSAVGEVEQRVVDLLAELRAASVPIALGRAFDSIERRRGEDHEGVPFLDGEVLDREEAEQLVLLSSSLLRRRGVLQPQESELVPAPNAEALVEYYANSIAHHIERISA